MSKISLKIGSFEIEYEGDQDFIENRLVELVQEVSALVPAFETSRSIAELSTQEDAVASSLSTNTIAQMADAKTGSDLVLAAISKIIVAGGRSTAARSEILSEMKEATTYYRETYASNLSSYLDNLVRAKRVNLVSKGKYALPAVERGRIESLLKNGE